MNYKLKDTDGYVTFLYRAGKDLVKSSMSIPVANLIISSSQGKVTKSDKADYPICVDDKWFFEGEFIKTTSKKNKGETK